MQHIKLDRLTSKEIKRLSGAMLGEVGSSRAVVDLIQRESEGNAFFIVEVVRALAQQAGQLDDIGRVTLPPQVFSGGIQTIIQRRLDRLPDWTIYPIQIASVAGRQINIPVLKYILPELDIDGWITACNEAAVIMPSSDDWLFAHDKIREHIQSNLIPKQNRDINKQVAEALEYTHADDLQQYAVVLAGHYQAAEDDVKEGNFAILAAKTLKDFFPPQALTFVDRALELEAYKHDAQSAHEEARLYLARGELLIRVNRYDDAYQSLMTAHEKYEALEDELGIARTDCVIGEWGLKVSKLKEAVPRLQNALTVLEKYEDWLQVGYAHMNIGVVYNYLGEVQKMKAHFEACYKVMREHGDPVSYAKSLNNLGNIEDMTGNQDRAEELHKEALGIRQRIKDYRGMGSSYMNLSFVAGEREQPHVQREYLLKALDNMRIVGDKANEANVLDALGKTERKLGNEMQALSYFEEALTLIEPLGAPRLHSTILFDLIRYYQTIDTQKSLTYLQQIVELLENMDHFWTRVGYILYGVDTLVQARVTDTRLVTWFATTLENREAYVGRNYITEVEDRLQDIFGEQIYEMAKVAGQNLTVEKAVTDLQAYIESYLEKLEQENGK
ncbi:MAG: tetratricopeptide repeat protein, partial [Chloroflexota bacterium]